jgi:type I restriction enzyme S subunit
VVAGLPDAAPLKYVCSLNQVTLPDDTPEDLEIRYIDISSVDELGNCAEPQPMEFGKAPSRARRIVRDGDLLVATVRTYLRAITHVEHAGANLICSTGFAVLTAGPRVLPRYLFYWTRSEPFVAAVVSRSSASATPP